jgi:hypothetical protein
LCQTEYIFNFILILYFKHNRMSSTKDTDYSFTVRTTVMTSVVVLGYTKQYKIKNIKIYGSIVSLIFCLSPLHYIYHFQLAP